MKLNDFSKEVPRNMVKTVALIEQVGGAMFTELEKMRLEDLEKYKNKKTRRKAIFHKWFRQL